ncbi:MAG: hypothetical protein JXR18_05575 [Neptuniibacter sp.]
MTGITPWGHIEWLLPKVNISSWIAIFCPSFEPRSVAAASWLAKSSYNIKPFGIKVDDPPNQYTVRIEQLTQTHEHQIHKQYSTYESVSTELLSELSVWNNIVNQLSAEKDCSILLDISSMPKRIFLFLIKRLIASGNVKDLVVCYSCAEGHREGKLTENSSPPSSIPGFSRVNESDQQSAVIVSVGYMAYNFSEFLQNYSTSTLPKFIFPFPPGSPSFRRNWRRLHDLLPAMERRAEIKRTHAMDMFAVLEWLKALGDSVDGNIDLIPLGPKPHTLAMGLAHLHFEDRSEIIYSQPRIYHPEYSHGIAKDRAGKPEIYAYCLRRNHTDYV